MNERRDRETLLNDILAEPGVDGRREKLLARTLGGAKRRRLVRRMRAAGSALATIVVLGFLAWRWVTMPDSGGAEKQEPAYVLIRTRPLPQAALVETRPLDFVNVISSVPSPHVDAFGTRASDPIYMDVDDNTLLALTAPRPAILVALGPIQPSSYSSRTPPVRRWHLDLPRLNEGRLRMVEVAVRTETGTISPRAPCALQVIFGRLLPALGHRPSVPPW